MAKNNNTERTNVAVEGSMDEVKKMTTILGIIVAVICIFYIITVIVTKNNGSLKYATHDEISEISYDTILASDIFLKNGTYYVLAYDDSNPYLSLFESYISGYMGLEEHNMVYYVDLNDSFNQKYIGEENSFDKNHLIFTSTTLLKIKDGNIESTYDSETSILEHLKNLTAEA